MEIKLVRPFFSASIYKVYGKLPRRREIRNPLGLQILAGVLIKQGHDIEIIDAELEGLDEIDIMARCRHADVVGITCTTPEFEIASIIASKVKVVNYNCKVILGGAHPTIVPEECLRESKDIDFIVRYEGEETFPDLLNNLDHPEKVKGIAYRNGGNIIITEDRPLLTDLDKHNADWSAVEPKRYLYPFPKEGLVPTANIQCGRGCFGRCRFCFRMFGNKVRLRKPEKVYEEMKFIKETFGITHFFFYDESFGIKKSWLYQLMARISKLNIKFFCMSRADLITEDTIGWMKLGGLVKLSMGVESGNQAILDNEKKGIKLTTYKQVYTLLTKHGIETRGSFIFGHPNETRETAQDTINFAKELSLFRAGFNVMTPYPGIDLLNDDGIEILSKDYSHYCRWGDSVIRTPELSPEDLKYYQRQALKEFYLSPKVLWYHLKQFLLGEHSAYYYRPLLFAIKELWNDILHKYSKAPIKT